MKSSENMLGKLVYGHLANIIAHFYATPQFNNSSHRKK